MNILLTADLHLTDNQFEEYRWDIFDILEKEAIRNNVGLIGILGDSFDRKDRHTGKLVNKFVSSLVHLQSKTQAHIIDLAGNHDAPLKGVFFWEFLNDYSNISYVTKPRPYCYLDKRIWLLPFSPNPTVEWENIPLQEACAIFMHQPIEGALIDERRKLDKAPPIPPLPNIPIFSGDIHHQQVLTINHQDRINSITYIGVPHPVHFNETWKNRIILIKDDDYVNIHEIWIDGIKRAIVELNDISELDSLNFKKKDQIRIRYNLTGENLTSWSSTEEKIKQWALSKGVHLASLEASIVGTGLKTTAQEAEQLEIMPPEQVVERFCKDEKLSKEIQNMGIQLLAESV